MRRAASSSEAGTFENGGNTGQLEQLWLDGDVCGQMRHERPPPRASVVPPSGRSECAKALLTSPRCPDRPAVASSDQKRPTAMTAREVELLFTSLAFEAGLSLFRAYDVS